MIISKIYKSSKRQLPPMDALLYEIGLVALCIFIAAVLLYFITGINVLKLRFNCTFNRLTRLPCPGCGGTRAFRALLRGEILKSIYDYPPLIYGVVVYIIFMIRCFLYRRVCDFKIRDGAVIKYIYIGVALIMIQWIVKLVAQMVYGYYWFL